MARKTPGGGRINMELDPNKYRLSEEEHQNIFETKIIPKLFLYKESTDKPVAVIFGGQPGAGKSAAVEDAIHELYDRGGAVDIIGDDLRGDHPQYDALLAQDDKTAAFYTDRDTGQWVEKAIAYAKEQKINIVIEGTMRDGNKVAETMESLRAAGYEIDARVLAVNEMLSRQGILHRYERQKADRGEARMTTPQSHQAAYDGIPLTLERIEREKLADRVTLYRRGAQAIYSNRLQGGEWLNEPQARVALEAERSRPMTLAELKAYARTFDDLADLLVKPERQATPDEIKALENLRQLAKDALAAEVARQETLAPGPEQVATQSEPPMSAQASQAEQNRREAAKEAEALALAAFEALARETVDLQVRQAEAMRAQRARLAAYEAELKAEADKARQDEERQQEREARGRQAEGGIRDAGDRYRVALAQHYDVRDPYGSLARAAMGEYGALIREREQLQAQLAKEDDPEKRQLIELRRDIQAADYMALTSRRSAAQTVTITGNRDNEDALQLLKRADAYEAHSEALRHEYRDLTGGRALPDPEQAKAQPQHSSAQEKAEPEQARAEPSTPEAEDDRRRAVDPRIVKEETQLAADQARRAEAEKAKLDRQLRDASPERQKQQRDAAQKARENREARERRDLLERQRDRERRERERALARGKGGRGDDGREM